MAMLDDLPAVVAGQVWRSPKARIADRTIVKMERWKYRVAVLIEGHGMHSLGEFRAWARRHGARPVPAKAEWALPHV